MVFNIGKSNPYLEISWFVSSIIPDKNILFLKKDDEKTEQEITEASSLLYDYKRHEYASNNTKMLVLELYDS